MRKWIGLLALSVILGSSTQSSAHGPRIRVFLDHGQYRGKYQANGRWRAIRHVTTEVKVESNAYKTNTKTVTSTASGLPLTPDTGKSSKSFHEAVEIFRQHKSFGQGGKIIHIGKDFYDDNRFMIIYELPDRHEH